MPLVAAVIVAAAMWAQSPATSPNTIWVAANVILPNGQLAPALSAADFVVSDNGTRQELSAFRNDRIPRLDVHDMASLLMPNDRVRLISFARDAIDVFGFMPGGATLDLGAMDAGGTSSLYDALVMTLATTSSADRPHLVFAVSDGKDNSSFSSAEHVVSVARTSNAVLAVTLVQSTNPLVREGGKVDAVDPLADEHSVISHVRRCRRSSAGCSTIFARATSSPTRRRASTEAGHTRSP